MTTTETQKVHNDRCHFQAECAVRETLAAMFTAPAWDAAAMDAENAEIAYLADVWLSDSTATCYCE